VVLDCLDCLVSRRRSRVACCFQRAARSRDQRSQWPVAVAVAARQQQQAAGSQRAAASAQQAAGRQRAVAVQRAMCYMLPCDGWWLMTE
jgi:hypothetical protein